MVSHAIRRFWDDVYCRAIPRDMPNSLIFILRRLAMDGEPVLCEKGTSCAPQYVTYQRGLCRSAERQWVQHC